MIFLCAVSESDTKSVPIISGKLRSTLKNLKDHKVWLDVYAPDDIEIQDLVSIYNIDKKLLIGHKSYSKILCFKNYIFFELSSYFLDEDDEINYNKSPMMYQTKAKFFIGENFIISFHDTSFPIGNQISSILMSKKMYDTFISDALTIIMDNILDDYYDVISNIRCAVTFIEDSVVDNYIDGMISIIRYNKKKWNVLDDLIEDQMNMFRPIRLSVMSWSNDTLKETMVGFYDDLFTISNTLTRVKDNITEIWNIYSVLSQNKINNVMNRIKKIIMLFSPMILLVCYLNVIKSVFVWNTINIGIISFIIFIYIIISLMLYFKFDSKNN